MIINTLNSDNSNIGRIKTEYCQIMETITYRTLKFELMIEKIIWTDYAFFTVTTLININSFCYNATLIRRNLHQF